MASSGSRCRWSGGGGHSSKAFRNIAGSASDGMIVVPAFWPGHFKNKEAAEFEKGFNAKYTALEGDEWSMFAYDAVMMMAAAMERTKSTEGAKVIPELFKQGQISGAAGTYRITPNGEIETTVFIGTWGPDGKVRADPRLGAPEARLSIMVGGLAMSDGVTRASAQSSKRIEQFAPELETSIAPSAPPGSRRGIRRDPGDRPRDRSGGRKAAICCSATSTTTSA